MRFPALTVLATAQHCTTTPSTLRWNGLDARCYQGHPRIQGPPSHCAALWISENSEARASIAGRGRVEPARGALQARQRGNIRIAGVIASRTGRLQNLQTQRTVNLFWRKGCVNNFQTVVSRKLLSMRRYRWLLSALSGNQRISALSNRKRFSKGVTWNILRFKLAGCHFWGRHLWCEHVQLLPFDVLHGQAKSSHIIWTNDPPGTAIFIQAARIAHSNSFNVQSPQDTSPYMFAWGAVRPHLTQAKTITALQHVPATIWNPRKLRKMQDIWIENKITSVHTGADGGLAALRV